MNRLLFLFAFAAMFLTACSTGKSANSTVSAADPIPHVSNELEIVSQEGPIQIAHDKNTDFYSISRSDIDREITDLYFVKRYFRYYQAFNAKREIVYFDDSLNVFTEVEDFYWTCGTVPHYTLTVEMEGNHFEVFSDETFFDMNGDELAVEIARISMADADEVMFINGDRVFNYTSNFGVGQEIQLDPLSIIIKQDNQYYFYDNQEVGYDDILFSVFSPSLKTIRNGLFGLHNIIEPQFSEIGEFEYYLAPVTLPSGEHAVLDVFGKVY